MTDITQKNRAGTTKIIGADTDGTENLHATVETIEGKRRFLVDTLISEIGPLSGVGAWKNTLRYVDMNASSGGVARGTSISTTYTTLFKYTGSGLFMGFNINLDSADGWTMKLTVDSAVIFEININDMAGNQLYNYKNAAVRETNILGLEMILNNVIFQSTKPIVYNTEVELEVKRNSTPDKDFSAGLAMLTKET